jgi:hypothetical protein
LDLKGRDGKIAIEDGRYNAKGAASDHQEREMAVKAPDLKPRVPQPPPLPKPCACCDGANDEHHNLHESEAQNARSTTQNQKQQ